MADSHRKKKGPERSIPRTEAFHEYSDCKYFEPAERVALYTLLGMHLPSDDQIAADAHYVAAGDPRRKGRDVRFRIEVVAAHNDTCLLAAMSASKFAGKRLKHPARGSVWYTSN